MDEIVTVDGINIEKAQFDDILRLKGIGPARMEALMRQVGRWEEYQEYISPIEVDGTLVEKTELRSYANLVGTWREFGIDPSDPKYAGEHKDRVASARRDFKRMRESGEISDYAIAQVVAKMKQQKEVDTKSEVIRDTARVTGVSLDDMGKIADKIQEKYERLLRDYLAPTAAAQARLLHVASLMVNLEVIDRTSTELNAGILSAKDVDKNLIQKQTYLRDQSRSITQEINSILKDFTKADEVSEGPAKYITNTLKKGKEAFDVFFLPVECPKCHTRYGVVGKFFPRSVAEFPVIDFECPVVHPSGKKCSGRVRADIDGHMDKQKVVKFTSQEYFDPSVVATSLLEGPATDIE